MMAKKVSFICMTRFKKPYAVVSNHEKSTVDIGYTDGVNFEQLSSVPRQQARMLAKRINEFLDASK